MRWEALFNDMEAQFAEGDRLSMEGEISERARADAAGLGLADRLRGSLGTHVKVHLVSGAVFEGNLTYAGADAVVLNDKRHQVLIPHDAVSRYAGLGLFSVSETSAVRSRIGLSNALRALGRDRSEVAVTLRGGDAEDPGVTGVIDKVGRDYVDLAAVRPGQARRALHVGQVSTIPFSALAAIRSPFMGEL
ncbi:hypothetical protein [Arthrobacter sp. B6]|uniref:hypothetical protein n=1 Tax=Arthrobacter sp. B6 TaxID=1570137 RepID=UPI000835E7B7|nr:hypothetical protein [Arthrobacter sp. B6]